jgi:hypothetical protein
MRLVAPIPAALHTKGNRRAFCGGCHVVVRSGHQTVSNTSDTKYLRASVNEMVFGAAATRSRRLVEWSASPAELCRALGLRATLIGRVYPSVCAECSGPVPRRHQVLPYNPLRALPNSCGHAKFAICRDARPLDNTLGEGASRPEWIASSDANLRGVFDQCAKSRASNTVGSLSYRLRLNIGRSMPGALPGDAPR